MSRTKKGKKPIGYDYWGKRALSGSCGFGQVIKKITARIERARAKASTRKEPIEPEYDEREFVPESSGGYISVDRVEALKQNWDMIQRIRRPANRVSDEDDSE